MPAMMRFKERSANTAGERDEQVSSVGKLEKNTLFYGDNLPILREYIPEESVDLVYLDPPFNSNRTYNVLFRDETGKYSEAQIKAFEDTWQWSWAAEQTYQDLTLNAPDQVATMIEALRGLLGVNQVLPYLVMMATRLLELHRVLKPTGSIYLHCDPTSSHYLKILMDGIYGPEQFRNEVIWRRAGSHNSSKRFGPIHDVLLFYSKSNRYFFQKTHRPYAKGHVDSYFRKVDENNLPDGFYVAKDDFDLPRYAGSSSVQIIVPEGIVVTFKEGLGHNNLYFMEDFDQAGGWVPTYRNVTLE